VPPSAPAPSRRLGWLLLIGYAHQLLLWSGDILMLYALLAPFVLALRHLSVRQLVALALSGFALWHGAFALAGWSSLTAAEAVHAGTADPATRSRPRRTTRPKCCASPIGPC
jgi:uncharacterized protein